MSDEPGRVNKPGGAGLAGFFWLWTPLNFEDRSVFFHVNADTDGKPWNTRAVILPDGAGAEGGTHSDFPRMEEVTLRQGTRHAERGTLRVPVEGGEAEVKLEQLTTLLEPLILVVMAAIVLSILLAIYLPIIQTISSGPVSGRGR